MGRVRTGRLGLGHKIEAKLLERSPQVQKFQPKPKYRNEYRRGVQVKIGLDPADCKSSLSLQYEESSDQFSDPGRLENYAFIYL